MAGVLGGLGLWFDCMGRVMRFLLLLLALLALPATASERLRVPSGQLVLPYEAIWEDHVQAGTSGETWLILRFLTPEIAKAAGKISFAAASTDIAYICENIGLPLVEMTGGGVHQVIINLMDQPIPRGQRDTEVTQFMSAYRVEEGTCIWE